MKKNRVEIRTYFKESIFTKTFHENFVFFHNLHQLNKFFDFKNVEQLLSIMKRRNQKFIANCLHNRFYRLVNMGSISSIYTVITESTRVNINFNIRESTSNAFWITAIPWRNRPISISPIPLSKFLLTLISMAYNHTCE